MAVYEQDLDRIVIRIVYDGAGRAGKTTNIEQLARLFGGESPDLQLLATDNGLTTYFDWFTFDGGMIDGHRLLIQVVGVPGARRFEHRRAHILRTADAIVLVCDSSPGTHEMARETLDSQREHLGKRAAQVPVIVQANKQDLPGALQAHEVGTALGLPYEIPVIGAEATAGIGTRETAVHAIRAAVRLVKRRTARPGILSIVGKSGTLASLRAALDTDAAPEPDDLHPTELLAAHAAPGTGGRRLARPTTVDEPHLVYVHTQSPAVQAAKLRVGEPGEDDPIVPPPRGGDAPEPQTPIDPAETLPSHRILGDDAPPEPPTRARKRRRDTETTEGRVQRNRKERTTQSTEHTPAPAPATPARSAPRKIPPRRRPEPATRHPSDPPTLPPTDEAPDALHLPHVASPSPTDIPRPLDRPPSSALPIAPPLDIPRPLDRPPSGALPIAPPTTAPPADISATARTLVRFTPQAAALLDFPPTLSTPFVDDLSPRPGDLSPETGEREPLPPLPDLPPGHVWPIPGGRVVLKALAAVVAPRVALPSLGDRAAFAEGPFHLTAQPYPDLALALAALRVRARTWQPVRPLLPALALAVAEERAATVRLWRVVPQLPPLVDTLSELGTSARVRLLEAFARALGQAFDLCRRHLITLDLHPNAWSVEHDRVVYLADELGASDHFGDVGPALLALAEQPGSDPALDSYIDALARELGALVEAEKDDLGLAAALSRAAPRTPTGIDARARLLAAAERRG